VDNAPKGEASAVSDGHRASLPVALHFAEQRLLGISFARNRAVTEALGRGADFDAFIDDDDVPDVDWLLCLLEGRSDVPTRKSFSATGSQESSPMCRSGREK